VDQPTHRVMDPCVRMGSGVFLDLRERFPF
jgi:hypothetical protein